MLVPRPKSLQSFRKIQKVGNLSRDNINISTEVRYDIGQLETSPTPEVFPGLWLGVRSADAIRLIMSNLRVPVTGGARRVGVVAGCS